MKKILILICILFAFSSNLAFAAPVEQSITSSFQNLAKKHLDDYTDDPRVLVYYVDEFVTYKVVAGWRKSKCVALPEYSYDIKKTDSLTTPYNAYLTYKMYVLISYPLATKELAEATETFKENKTPDVYRISFSYQNGIWIPEKYEELLKIEGYKPEIRRFIEKDNSSTIYKRVVVKDLNNH